MEKLDEAVSYFKQNEGYTRLFKLMKNKYIVYGEIKGNVIINKPSKLEKQVLSGLMKKDYARNMTITISLKKLQEMLDNTKFEGVQLPELLKGYFKEEILTKKESKKQYQTNWEQFLDDILKQNENTIVYPYLKNSIDKKDELYQNIKKHYNKENQILKKELINACNGINNLPKQITRIPVFASNIFSNPHGFDKKTLCGRLFIALLCYIKQVPYPKNSEKLSELYYENNLLVDDVSNMVLCKGIKAYTKGKQHEGWIGFANKQEPIFITLYNLANIDSIEPPNTYKDVVITENPAVFMEIVEKCKTKDFPLVCTYGQVKLAGIMLLDLLTKAGYNLYYSGDLDPEGLQIADNLKQRYQEKMQFFGFNETTYYKNISQITLSNKRLQKLEGIKSPELKQLCKEIAKNKKAAYEEKNIEAIIKFID